MKVAKGAYEVGPCFSTLPLLLLVPFFIFKARDASERNGIAVATKVSVATIVLSDRNLHYVGQITDKSVCYWFETTRKFNYYLNEGGS